MGCPNGLDSSENSGRIGRNRVVGTLYGEFNMASFVFRFDKTLQAAGMFLRLNGGRMEFLKLLKLLYIADRECLGVEGDTITGDNVRAMKHGPVLMTVYNLIKNNDDPQAPLWHRYIKRCSNHSVYVAKDPGTLDLCRYEKEVVEQIYSRYGKENTFDLVKLTHSFPEWQKYEEYLAHRPCIISIEDILEGLDKMDMTEQVQQNITTERFHHKLFQSQ
jgi:uncharacterized phage-associated protein